jgi:hypothetical protein
MIRSFSLVTSKHPFSISANLICGKRLARGEIGPPAPCRRCPPSSGARSPAQGGRDARGFAREFPESLILTDLAGTPPPQAVDTCEVKTP